jgi:hypothetical protein
MLLYMYGNEKSYHISKLKKEIKMATKAQIESYLSNRLEHLEIAQKDHDALKNFVQNMPSLYYYRHSIEMCYFHSIYALNEVKASVEYYQNILENKTYSGVFDK